MRYQFCYVVTYPWFRYLFDLLLIKLFRRAGFSKQFSNVVRKLSKYILVLLLEFQSWIAISSKNLFSSKFE